MRLFIDCEWNSFKGSLISMALVSENGDEWYQELACEHPHPWIAENVIPKLTKTPISERDFAISLQEFLMRFDSVHIVADWPEDIARFCDALIVDAGVRINTPPLTMEVIRIDSVSENPHNALADARGLRKHLQ